MWITSQVFLCNKVAALVLDILRDHEMTLKCYNTDHISIWAPRLGIASYVFNKDGRILVPYEMKNGVALQWFFCGRFPPLNDMFSEIARLISSVLKMRRPVCMPNRKRQGSGAWKRLFSIPHTRLILSGRFSLHGVLVVRFLQDNKNGIEFIWKR